MQDADFDIYVGMMSGTSLDGVDAVAAVFNNGEYQQLARTSEPYSALLKSSLLSLCASGDDEINRMQVSSNEIAKIYAKTFRKLLYEHGLEPSNIRAIGAHGQTVRHNPQFGSSTQLLNGALLAELTGVDVIMDFRSRDLAAGGQGAPLVPAFHQAVFSSSATRAIINIGGISNITVLPPKGSSKEVIGFDCGPGNMLLDAWISENIGYSYDKNGDWARLGEVSDELLYQLKSDPIFSKEPPKSTGRELFNPPWLKNFIKTESAVDVQRTLLALTVEAITDAINHFCPETEEIYICGGGSKNKFLMEELTRLNAPRKVSTTSELGLDTQDVEAAAFAWLAKRFVGGKSGNLPSVTGAQGYRVLGCLYPA